MRILKLLFLPAFASLITPQPARAWDGTGHKVVARIAWESMTPLARARAIQLLNAAAPSSGLFALRPAAGPNRDRDFFVAAATWPDVIKTNGVTGHSFSRPDWHFRDQFWRLQNGTPADVNMPPHGDLLERLRDFSDSVGNTSIPRARRARYLAWLIHLVGDAHQPLHDSSRLPPEVVGDSGGNSFKLPGPSNLHSYWDHILTNNSGGATVGALAARLRSEHPQSQFQSVPGDLTEWTRAGLEISKRDVYDGVQPMKTPDDAYRRKALGIAESQIALAGYRLAALLNASLGT